MMAKKKHKKVRVNPHVPVKLATTAATSVDRKAEAVRRPKISHSVQRQPTVGKLARKRKASQSVTIAVRHRSRRHGQFSSSVEDRTSPEASCRCAELLEQLPFQLRRIGSFASSNSSGNTFEEGSRLRVPSCRGFSDKREEDNPLCSAHLEGS